MTKATCHCGATIETESLEMLTVWMKEHRDCNMKGLTVKPIEWPQPTTPYAVPHIPGAPPAQTIPVEPCDWWRITCSAPDGCGCPSHLPATSGFSLTGVIARN
jgi:hypothetical protein